MRADTRLAKVERHLSPRQLVIREVIESRRKYRTFVESGQALARTGIPRPTLLDRIAASVNATNPGTDRKQQHRLVRSAQREGLFLARLSNEVAVQVVEEERGFELMTALMAAHLALLFSSRKVPEEKHLELWLTSCIGHRRKLLAMRAAVTRIEEAYFDNAKLLYSASDELIAENLARVDEVLAMAFGPLKSKSSKRMMPAIDIAELGPTPEEVALDAEALATGWVTNVQAMVAVEFGEDEYAVRLLGGILLGVEDKPAARTGEDHHSRWP